MAGVSAAYFHLRLEDAKRKYRSDYDRDEYFSNTLKAILQILAEENGHKKISSILSVSSPVFAAILDECREAFYCPIDNMEGIEDLLHSLNNHIKDRLRKDYYEPAEKYLPQQISSALNGLIELA